MQREFSTLTVCIFFAALLLNFFCLFSLSSNTLALTLLALCCPLAFLAAGERPRLTWYHALFILFIGYLFLHNTFIFPEEKSFAFRRKAVLAFLAGMAAFQILKNRNMRFLYLMNLALPFVLAGVAVLTALGTLSYESLFHGPRLVLHTKMPNNFGMMLSICLMSGLAFLLHGRPEAARPFGAVTDGRKRLFSLVRGAAESRPFVLCSTAASFALLLATHTKTSIFAVLIVGGLFSAYIFVKRFGLLRTGGLFLLLALCSVFVWQFCPLGQQHKDRFYKDVLSKALTPWDYPTVISRKPIWESGILAFKERPLFGIGLNAFKEFHQDRVRADYDRLIALYGKELVDRDTVRIGSPHNDYLLWFAETGCIGGALFCLLFFAPLASCLKQRTLYGEMGLILSVYAISFLFLDVVNGGRRAEFGVTVIFMTLGYFSGILGKSPPQRQETLAPAGCPVFLCQTES